MSTITVYISFKKTKKEMQINENETIRTVMTKAFDLFNEREKYYTKDKYIFKDGDEFLNNSETDLNKTAKVVGLEEDTSLELIKTDAINEGR